jgi:hypothetical protein
MNYRVINHSTQFYKNLMTRNLIQKSLIFLLLIYSSVLAHSSTVNIDIIQQNNSLIALLTNPDGFAIKNAKLEFILLSKSKEIYRTKMPETGEGAYVIPVPDVKPGAYTLVMRDTTFPKEALEVKGILNLPISIVVSLLLPASKSSDSSPSLLIFLIAAPIVVSVLILVLVLLRRPKTMISSIKPTSSSSS